MNDTEKEWIAGSRAGALASADHLRLVVPVMRELGVLTYGSITLDPAWTAPPKARKPRTPAEASAIAKAWRAYRIDRDAALIDGTEIPTPPTEPEEDAHDE